MECNCNNNNNGGVIPWVRGNRLPLCICIYQMSVGQGTVSTMAYNTMTRMPYEIQADDTVTVTMKSGFRSVEMPFTTDGNKVLVIDNGELPTGTYTVEVTIERGSGERGRWQESRQVRIYENTDEAILGEMYSIEADLFFWAKGDTGNGIANITSNPDDTLTITMTDGTTYTTQAMKGDKGDKGDQGEKGTSIVSFDVTGQTETSVIYTVTFSDDTTEEVAVPKGPQGDTGLTGNGIASTTLNSDYTLTIAYTDGTTYTTSSIRGAQGIQGVSIIAFTQTGETSTNTLYNVVFSDGRTQSVAIPKGLKGDKGDTGNTGPQGSQGPKGDTVTATDYTLYNVQGSDSQGAMSQDATTKAISAQTGYYTCGAAADKVDKVAAVENGNLYKRTLGGHFKVKMTNANTASGVTLQVGSETATTLWYNGAAASADNSWDAGEVLSVYYDGSVYQSSNAQGGGGKAEKIKYDNSESGLASDNVQGALDETMNRIDSVDKVSDVTRNVGGVDSETGETDSTVLTLFYTDIEIPSNAMSVDFQAFKTGLNWGCAFFNGNTFIEGSGYKNKTLDTGTRVTLDIPSGATIFRFGYVTDATAISGNFPLFDYVSFSIPPYMKAKNVGYDNTLSGFGATDVQGTIDAICLNTPYKDVVLGNYTDGIIFNNTWSIDRVSNTKKHKVIELKGNEKYLKVTANDLKTSGICFLKTYTAPSLSALNVDWCDGYSAPVGPDAGNTAIYKIPSDCGFIVVDCFNGATIYEPNYIGISVEQQELYKANLYSYVEKQVVNEDFSYVNDVWVGNSATSYTSNTGSRIAFLPLDGYEKIKVIGIAGSRIAFVQSNTYTGEIPYSEKYPSVIELGAEEKTFAIPNDAKYMMFCVTYSGKIIISPSISLINGEDLENAIGEYSYTEVVVSDGTSVPYFIPYVNGIWHFQSTSKSYIIKVPEYASKMKVSTSVETRIFLLQDDDIPTGTSDVTAHLCDSTERIVVTNSTAVIDIPNDCYYVGISAYNGSSGIMYDNMPEFVGFLINGNKSLVEQIKDIAGEAQPLSSLRLGNCHLAVSSFVINKNTIYWPWIIRTRHNNALAKYYMYFSEDHVSDSPIYMAYSDDLSKWNYYGIVATSSAQLGASGDIETPTVIWDDMNERYLMYYHSLSVDKAGTGYAQTSYISESVDGISWTYVKPLTTINKNKFCGNFHNGYFRADKIGNLWYGHGLVGGGNAGMYTRYYSYDGLNWMLNPYQMANKIPMCKPETNGNVSSMDEIVLLSGSYFNVNGHHYIAYNGGTLGSGIAQRTLDIYLQEVSDDWFTPLGKAKRMTHEETNLRSLNVFVDDDGEVYFPGVYLDSTYKFAYIFISKLTKV